MSFSQKECSKSYGLLDIFQDLNRYLEPMGLTTAARGAQLGDWTPHVDIHESDQNYSIAIDVPGVDSKDISVHMENGRLTIKGHKETRVQEEHQKYLKTERQFGSFVRVFMLPETVDAEHIRAASKNGVLTITVPKTTRNTTRKIQIEESA